MANQITIRKDAPSGTIVINRPDKRNAISHDLIGELQLALEDFHQERSVRGLILTGAGDVFCSGTDLSLIHGGEDELESMRQWHDEVNDFRTLLETMLRYPKPLVAAVNGPVIGSGVALMLACDFVVAGQSATLSLPEVQRGLVPGISAPLLVFRVGAAIAAKMMLSGSKFDAEYLAKIGLFNEAVADELVWARAHEVVTQLAKGAPSSHQLIKQLLNETIGEALFTHLSIGAANTAAARSTDSAKKGVDAFLEKNPVEWD